MAGGPRGHFRGPLRGPAPWLLDGAFDGAPLSAVQPRPVGCLAVPVLLLG